MDRFPVAYDIEYVKREKEKYYQKKNQNSPQ